MGKVLASIFLLQIKLARLVARQKLNIIAPIQGKRLPREGTGDGKEQRIVNSLKFLILEIIAFVGLFCI